MPILNKIHYVYKNTRKLRPAMRIFERYKSSRPAVRLASPRKTSPGGDALEKGHQEEFKANSRVYSKMRIEEPSTGLVLDVNLKYSFREIPEISPPSVSGMESYHRTKDAQSRLRDIVGFNARHLDPLVSGPSVGELSNEKENKASPLFTFEDPEKNHENSIDLTTSAKPGPLRYNAKVSGKVDLNVNQLSPTQINDTIQAIATSAIANSFRTIVQKVQKQKSSGGLLTMINKANSMPFGLSKRGMKFKATPDRRYRRHRNISESLRQGAQMVRNEREKRTLEKTLDVFSEHTRDIPTFRRDIRRRTLSSSAKVSKEKRDHLASATKLSEKEGPFSVKVEECSIQVTNKSAAKTKSFFSDPSQNAFTPNYKFLKQFAESTFGLANQHINLSLPRQYSKKGAVVIGKDIPPFYHILTKIKERESISEKDARTAEKGDKVSGLKQSENKELNDSIPKKFENSDPIEPEGNKESETGLPLGGREGENELTDPIAYNQKPKITSPIIAKSEYLVKNSRTDNDSEKYATKVKPPNPEKLRQLSKGASAWQIALSTFLSPSKGSSGQDNKNSPTVEKNSKYAECKSSAPTFPRCEGRPGIRGTSKSEENKESSKGMQSKSESSAGTDDLGVSGDATKANLSIGNKLGGGEEMGKRKSQSSPRKKLQSAVELCIKRMREDKLKRRSLKKNIENKLLKSDIKSKALKERKLGSDSNDDKSSGKVAPQDEKCTRPDIGKFSHTDGKGPSKLSTIDCSKYKTEESKGSKEEFQKGKQHSESFRPQANSTKPDSTKSKPLGKKSSTRVKSDEEHTEIDCQEIFARLQKESAKSRLKTRKTIDCKKLAEILHSSKKAKSDKKAAYSGDDTRTPDTMGSTQGYSNKHALKADQNIDVSKCRPLDSKDSEKTPSSRIGSSTKIDCSKFRILGIDDSKKANSQDQPIAASCGKPSFAHQFGLGTSSDKKLKANSEGVSGIDCSKYNISEKRSSTEGARNTAIDRGKPELAQQSEISKPIDCSKYRNKESKDSPPVDFKSQSSVDSKAAREILEAINDTDFRTVCKKPTFGKETKPKDEPEPKVNIKDSGKSTFQETRFAERDCIKSDLVSKGSDNPKGVEKCQMQGSRAGFSDCSMVKSTGSQVSRTGSVCAKPERGDLKARDTAKSEAPTASPKQNQPSLACKKAEKKGTFAKGKTETPDKARSCSPTKFETLQKDLRNKPIISCSTFMTPIIDSQKEKSKALSQFDRTSTKFGKGFEKPIPLGNEFMTAVNVLHEENLCKVPEARMSKKDFQKGKSTSMGYSRCGINKPKSADNKYQTPETKNRINATHKKLTPTEGSGRESSKTETGIDCSKYKTSYNKDTNKLDLQQGSSSAINYNKLAQVEQNTSTSPNCVSKTPGGTDYCKHKVSEVKNFAKATHAVGPGVQTSRPKMEEIKNIDCNKYILGSKDKNKSLPEESSKPGSVHQTGPDKFKPMANVIDCSKYKVKEFKDSSNANPERKSETRSVKGIDCNKYPTFNTSQEGKDANKATLQKGPASINRCARPVSATKAESGSPKSRTEAIKGSNTEALETKSSKNIDCSKYLTPPNTDTKNSTLQECGKPTSTQKIGSDEVKTRTETLKSIDCSKYNNPQIKDSTKATTQTEPSDKFNDGKLSSLSQKSKVGSQKSETGSLKAIDCSQYLMLNSSQGEKDTRKASLQKHATTTNDCARTISAKQAESARSESKTEMTKSGNIDCSKNLSSQSKDTKNSTPQECGRPASTVPTGSGEVKSKPETVKKIDCSKYKSSETKDPTKTTPQKGLSDKMNDSKVTLSGKSELGTQKSETRSVKGIDCSKYTAAESKGARESSSQGGASSRNDCMKPIPTQQTQPNKPILKTENPNKIDCNKYKTAETKGSPKTTLPEEISTAKRGNKINPPERSPNESSKSQTPKIKDFTSANTGIRKSAVQESCKPATIQQTGPDKLKPGTETPKSVHNVHGPSKIKDSTNPVSQNTRSGGVAVKEVDCSKYKTTKSNDSTESTSQKDQPTKVNHGKLEKRSSSVAHCNKTGIISAQASGTTTNSVMTAPQAFDCSKFVQKMDEATSDAKKLGRGTANLPVKTPAVQTKKSVPTDSKQSKIPEQAVKFGIVAGSHPSTTSKIDGQSPLDCGATLRRKDNNTQSEKIKDCSKTNPSIRPDSQSSLYKSTTVNTNKGGGTPTEPRKTSQPNRNQNSSAKDASLCKEAESISSGPEKLSVKSQRPKQCDEPRECRRPQPFEEIVRRPAKRIVAEQKPAPFNCCLKIAEPRKVVIDECNMPQACDDYVIVKMRAVGLCGSDVYMFDNGIKELDSNDVSLGHEGAGEVVEVGPRVKHLRRDDRVCIEPGITCGFCKFCKVGRYNLCPNMKFKGLLSNYCSHPEGLCHKIPKTMEFEKAALAHPLSLGLHACHRGRVTLGSRVLILGASPLGLSCVMAAKAMGAGRVAIIDDLEKNLKVACDLCADAAILVNDTSSPAEVALALLREMKYRPNVVIDCCGCSKTINISVTTIEEGGDFVLAGCQAKRASIPILAILAKELRLHTSFRSLNMFPTALNMIDTGRAPVEKMITHRQNFCEARKAFDIALNETKNGAIKVMVVWPEPQSKNKR